MYDTSGSHSVCYTAPPDTGVAGRLNWLEGELARQETAHAAPCVADEWRAMRSVTLGKTYTAEEAYTWFGTFLGLFPPLAIFARTLGAMQSNRPESTEMLFLWGVLFLLMNAVCCLVGSVLGAFVGRTFGEPGRRDLSAHLSWSLLMAIMWGAVTGAAGGSVALLVGCFLGAAAGLLGFFIGAVAGAICAVPVALAAFPLFALHHRMLSRGGMIEARRLWPLACGVPLTAAAVILNLWGN